jgi:hypothetical protein
MSALAEYRTNILELLNDPDNDRFTNDQVDAALRWALVQYTKHRPLIATYSLDTDGKRVIELPDDFDAIHITDVELFNDDIELIRKLGFEAWKSDESWFVEVPGGPIPADEVLTITYTAPNTIDDLDGAAGTTIPPEDEHLVQVGAAGHALFTRAASGIEANNLNDDTAQRLMQLAHDDLEFYNAALTPSPKSGGVTLPPPPTNVF